MALHNDFGNSGEKLAEEYLLRKGFSILEKNWRFKKAEIDIIAMIQNTLVVVEVKSRSSNYQGNPQDFVNHKKISLLVSAANEFVIRKNLDVLVRFDIIAILKTNNKMTLDHIENAFLHF
jgi:putative endonuclease